MLSLLRVLTGVLIVFVACNQMPASVAAEFGMASDAKVTFQGMGFEYPPTDDGTYALLFVLP